jgi:hypothetical protein
MPENEQENIQENYQGVLIVIASYISIFHPHHPHPHTHTHPETQLLTHFTFTSFSSLESLL